MKGEFDDNVPVQADFEISSDVDLDSEVMGLPTLYDKWSTLSARALKAKNEIELERKILNATLYKEAKQRGEKALKKPTGADIEAEIHTDSRFKEISQRLIDAEERSNLMEGGKWSVVEKSKSVSQLCEDRDKGWFIPDFVRREESRDAGVQIRATRPRINRE